MDLKPKHPARTSRSLAKGLPELALGTITFIVLGLIDWVGGANLDAQGIAIVTIGLQAALQFARRQFRDWFGVTDA
jgi:hypothetical protein